MRISVRIQIDDACLFSTDWVCMIFITKQLITSTFVTLCLGECFCGYTESVIVVGSAGNPV